MTEQIHLVVATPCFGGQVSSIYASSIFQLQRVLRSKSNVQLKVLMRDGDALITRARANLMTMFLDDPTATHFLFVDADIGFEPEQVFRLIESGADVVAGVYPIKRVNWEKVKRAIENRRPKLASASLDYVLEINDPDHVAVVNGFTRVRYAGTGFLMIRRHVFERMCAHPDYASLQFFREHSLDALAGSPNRFALFECMIDPRTGTYLSEDFAFCKRWTDIGGEIWADLESKLDHVGPSVFNGDISAQFAAPVLATEQQILSSHQLFRLKDSPAQPRLRVLALAAASDIGGNTPIEFLLTGSGIELTTLYVMPEIELPASLPDHDIAIVIASD